MAKKEYLFKENTFEEVLTKVIEFRKAISDNEFPLQKIKVTFNDEVEIRHNVHKLVSHKEILLAFFTYGKANDDVAYSTRISPRHGHAITHSFIKNLKSFEISSPDDKELNITTKTLSLLGKIHSNLWGNIKEELSKDPALMSTKYYSNFSTINISGKFSKSVIDRLKQAIENKENYNHKEYGTKRDLSVEVKICDDGVMRAWYSSEYSGCGNGAYYLLLNPTVAGFREDD